MVVTWIACCCCYRVDTQHVRLALALASVAANYWLAVAPPNPLNPFPSLPLSPPAALTMSAAVSAGLGEARLNRQLDTLASL